MKISELIKNHCYIYEYQDEVIMGKFVIEKSTTFEPYTRTIPKLYRLKSFHREIGKVPLNISLSKQFPTNIKILQDLGESCDLNVIKRKYPEYFI